MSDYIALHRDTLKNTLVYLRKDSVFAVLWHDCGYTEVSLINGKSVAVRETSKEVVVALLGRKQFLTDKDVACTEDIEEEPRR